MKQLPYDYSRCHPKWPFPCCKDCMRHIGRHYNQVTDRHVSVTDFSQDTKGDQLQECGSFIDENDGIER